FPGFAGEVARSIQPRRRSLARWSKALLALGSVGRCFTPSRRTGFRPFPPRQNHLGGSTAAIRAGVEPIADLSQRSTRLVGHGRSFAQGCCRR
ncbi:unnamed protein product, partial [Callosobruchus maculatus]